VGDDFAMLNLAGRDCFHAKPTVKESAISSQDWMVFVPFGIP
jgi:hypothetical protein